MLVYGDTVLRQDARAMLAGLWPWLKRVAAMPPGLARHAELCGAFLEAGQWAQGLADAGFAARGCDAPSPADDQAMALVLQLAQALRHSWQSDFQQLPELPHPIAPALPEAPIAVKQPEGFAFYALYPEAYLQAAQGSGLGPGTRVIGLRSIGLPLAAMVAAGLNADAPLTLRPVGPPFRRQLALSAETTAALVAPAPGWAIVDEGPGLSGSSVACVAEALPPAALQVHLFPGHAGAPGPEASTTHRALWQRLPRHVTSLDDLLLTSDRPARRLDHWVADLTGPAEAPLQDVSGGAWRALRYDSETAWPPVHSQQERRKFLLRSERGAWLLKFAGLGRDGQRRAAMGEALARAGFTPPVAGLQHGFLVAPWLPARGLDQQAVAPQSLFETVARYLAFRAQHFPAACTSGASAAALWQMACHNTGQALGTEAAAALVAQRPRLDALDGVMRRCATDGRMQPWEWLCLADGRLLKADALDHHAAHDLVGCQDIAWDLIGAEIELGLDVASLAAAVGRLAGQSIDPALLAFYRPCYLAFRLGERAMAASAHAHWPQEAARLAATEGYARRLQALL